ncbi:MAG: hypothetical protein EBY39_10875, partial [Flavobacteriia bacterium]|nr:hypothetical protein [Flavobacteriia bacterium]
MQAGSSAIGDHEKLVEDANKNKKELLKREKRLKSLLDRNNKIIQDRNASGLQKLRLEGRSNKLQEALNRTIARRTTAEQQAASRASGGAGLGGFAGRTSGRMGRMFSGNTGMTMMIGAPMAAGFLQSGGAGQTGAGSAMYAAGGALQGAASGGMMASMIAPFFGPAAPLVIGVGTLGGAISGLISASKENTAALNEQIRDQNAALIQSENNMLATAIMSASKNNKSMFGVGSLEKLFSGYTPKEGETFGESMYNLSVPEATRKKLETGQIEGLKEEDFYKTNVPQVKQFIKTNKIDALVATGLEDINSIYNQQLKVFNNKIAGLTSRLPGGKNFESGGNNTAEIRGELDELIKTRNALRQDISDRESKGLRDILSQNPEELRKLYEESDVAKERTQQFLNRSGNVKQILRSIMSGSEDVNFDLGKDGVKAIGKLTASGKEIINALDNIKPTQLELLFSRVAELYLDQEKSLQDQNKAVILQLNLQKAMIQAQQKSAEAQLDIKAEYIDMSNSLKIEKQLMGGLISEERKARIDFIGAINKAKEAYKLGTNQAKSEFKKGLISDISSGQNAGLTQALKQNLFKGLDEAALKDKTTVDLTNELNSKTAEELLSILKEIGVNEDQANKIVENRSLLYENQITLLDKQKTLSESQANSELTINNILGKRRELLEDMNQSIQNFNRNSSFLSESSALDKRITDASRSVGGYTPKQKQLQLDRADLESRITPDIVRKSSGAKLGILQQASKDLEIGGFTNEEIDKILKMEGKEVDISSILESRFKDAGGKNEITNLQDILGGYGKDLLSDEEFQQTVGGGETRQEMKQRLEELKILDQQRLGVNEDLDKKIKDINDSLIQQNILKEKGVQAVESELSAREKNDRYMRGQSVSIDGQVDDRSAISRGMSDSFAEMRDQAQYMHYEIGKRIPNAFADGLAGALTDAINGAASLEDALRSAALTFLKELQGAFMKNIVSNIVGQMGGGMTNALGFSYGGNVRKYSKGGSVPAMVSNGEYVMNKEAVNRYGGSFMHALNAGGKIPKYADGGWVDSGLSGAFASPPSTYSPPEFSTLPPKSFKNRFLDFIGDENNMKLFQQEYQKAQVEAFAPTTALADIFKNSPSSSSFTNITDPENDLSKIFAEPPSKFSVLPPRSFKDRMMGFLDNSDNMNLFEEQYKLAQKKAGGIRAFSFKNQPSAQQKMQRATSPFNWKRDKDGTINFESTP